MPEPASAPNAPPAGGPIGARVREFGRTDRIVGVDVARGLAVLGMFGAHLGQREFFDWGDPASWDAVVNGRSSILFALLAGVSIAIISGRRRSLDAALLSRVRVRIVIRAIIIFAIGLALELLGTNVAVILTYYGVLFLLALPFLRWRPRSLFALAGLIAIVMPLLLLVPQQTTSTAEFAWWTPAAELLVTGNYPSLVWIAFVLAGLAIGRLDLTSVAVQRGLVAIGVLLAVFGYTSGELAAASAQRASLFAFGADWSDLFTTEPHSGSPFEVVGSAGFAIAVLGVCLLVSRVIRLPLLPIAAVGAMALSVYTAQIVAIAALGIAVPGNEDNQWWGWFTLAALAACTAWALLVGKGPLEWMLTLVSTQIAGVPREKPQPSRQ